MATWGLSSQIDVQVHIYCVHYFDLPPSLGMMPQTDEHLLLEITQCCIYLLYISYFTNKCQIGCLDITEH